MYVVLQVTVTDARDRGQAKRVAKAIVNSSLIKTAVHGADPNWGRVVMADGKCTEDTDIDPQRGRVAFGGLQVYPAQPGEDAASGRRGAGRAAHDPGERRDMTEILTSFCARLYGRRSAKNRAKKALEAAAGGD